MTKHFFKVLTVFSAMIVLGLIGVFVINYFGEEQIQATSLNETTRVAE